MYGHLKYYTEMKDKLPFQKSSSLNDWHEHSEFDNCQSYHLPLIELSVEFNMTLYHVIYSVRTVDI